MVEIGRLNRIALPAALLVAAAALTGCTSNPVGETVGGPASPEPTATDVVAPTPTAPPPTQRAADATPVSVRCGKLVPKPVAQLLVPELARVKGWEAEEGTVAAQLAGIGGTACAWTDEAGDMLQVAVAKPGSKDATELKNDLVRRSNSVPTYGGEAYFQVVDHVGRIDAFRGRTWISARSNRFFEPGDAADVVASIDAALGFEREATPSPAPSAADGAAGATPAPTPTP